MSIKTTNARMQQLTGKWSDLNTDNLLVGEMAVPNDHNPVVKTSDGNIKEIALLGDMSEYENYITQLQNSISQSEEIVNRYDEDKTAIAQSEANAKQYADNASASEANSSESATISAQNAQLASQSEANAKQYSDNATSSANSAKTYNDNAKTYMDSANAYAKEAKEAAASITGALKPKGTILFENLPLLSSTDVGVMYNISNEFISTSDFKDGGNITYPAGTNVYKTDDNMWDCLAGQLSNYLLLDDVDVAVENSMPDYEESTTLQELVAGEKLSTAFGKIKTAIKNLISIVKLLGTTDISGIGDGSITGALSELNSNFTKSTNYSFDEQVIGTFFGKPLYGRYVDFGELTNTNKYIIHNIPNIKSAYINIGKSCWCSIEIDFDDIGGRDMYSLIYSGFILQIYINRTQIMIKGGSSVIPSSYKALIYVEYTKTTD